MSLDGSRSGAAPRGPREMSLRFAAAAVRLLPVGVLSVLSLVPALEFGGSPWWRPGAADALALPVSPRDGGPFPAVVEQVREQIPTAYTFSRAWIAETERKKEIRAQVARGEISLQGMSPAEVRRLTAVTGSRYVPVMLGKYSDTGADPITAANLQTELFDGPWPTGTMTEYYDEISYGDIALTGTVYNWVTTSNTDDYYCGGQWGIDPVNSKTGEFITEVLQANDPAVDFSVYDNDGPDNIPNSGDDDGFVDFVAIVHPDEGGECGPGPVHDMWSHRWQLTGWPQGIFTTNDARTGGGFIRVNDYTIMPALSCGGSMIEIGVFCHEFGHAFGLPDLYDTSTQGANCTTDFSEGVGEWCLMGGGNWNSPESPAHMSAWAKTELGWINPGVVAFDLPAWPIQSATLTPTALKMWTNGTPGTEYFLVEYRTAHGFDAEIHAPGLLIWHIDENVSSNQSECHPKVDLECNDQSGADHVLDHDDLAEGVGSGGNRGDAGDPFCEGSLFAGATSPSSDAYNGSNTQVLVEPLSACGPTSIRATLLVGQPGEDVDLCMRDCGADVCTEPSPCNKFWASPEIYIDNNSDGIIDPPAEGIPNQLFARVRNVGVSMASDVDVDFYFADPGMGLLFPSTGMLIDSDDIPLIAPGSSEVAGVLWTIPYPPPTINHYCLGVIATNPQDGQIDERARYDDNLAQINIQELYAKAGDVVPPRPGQPPVTAADGEGRGQEPFVHDQTFQVCNPGRETCNLEIRLGSPPRYDDVILPPDWSLDLEFQQVILPPGECRELRVRLIDEEPVHTDFAYIPFTLLCNGQEVVGGTDLRVEIDNVAPRAPCGFSVQHVPPEGDDSPGRNAIRIRWDDDLFDELGFPERVERWRIYRGSHPDFVPNPENLLIETCIDEDPSTVPYEHFADFPGDRSLVWYKLQGIDRAGNGSRFCTEKLDDGTSGSPDPAPAGLLMLAGQPNPFGGVTEISYALPSPSDVDLRIFTLHGRQVRLLAGGPAAAGHHRILWDGKDDDGREAAAGVYVCRLRAGGLQRSIRLVSVR